MYIITFWVSSLILAILWLFTLSETKWLIHVDKYVNQIIPLFHNSLFNILFFWISEIFEPDWFVMWFGALLIALLVFKKYYEAIFLFFGVAGGQFVKFIMKNITDKPRPDNPFGIIDTESSFPSGHATTNIFLFLVFLHFVAPHIKKPWKLPTNILLAIFVLAFPFSRIFLQVHYTSDVLAGMALGVASFSFTVLTFEYLFPKIYRNIKSKIKLNNQ